MSKQRRGMMFLVALAGGCASTEIDRTWKDPSARGILLSRVAVVCLCQDVTVRRLVEDEVVKQMGGTAVFPSHKALPDVDLKDRALVKQRLSAHGFDGVLVMRLAAVSEEAASPGPAPIGTFDGYYGWAYGMSYGAPVGTVVRMVTNLYSLTINKLVWSGQSRTFDPGSARNLVDDVSRAVGKELIEDHLII
jgi:hypothetical protein